MVVIGFERKHFSFDNGEVDGFNLFLSETRPSVTGIACERVFISDRKLGGYVPALDDNVNIYYNRYGKPETISKL